MGLRCDQVELETGRLHVQRVKNGDASAHLLNGKEVRALRKLQRQAPESLYIYVLANAGEDASTIQRYLGIGAFSTRPDTRRYQYRIKRRIGGGLSVRGLDLIPVERQMFRGQ